MPALVACGGLLAAVMRPLDSIHTGLYTLVAVYTHTAAYTHTPLPHVLSYFPRTLPRRQHAEVGKRGVSMDEWTMLLQFCREISPDCDNFQAMLYSGHAWPRGPCVAIQLQSCTRHSY